ncbi:MAG: FG-GAP-like repeat-containing protein [Acidobacteria bacterium]|nr:FG-GAP-like repeat-containing protein [Acidobacteriota bacterium]
MEIGLTRGVSLLLSVACAAVGGVGVQAQHWPQFRGNQGLGVADEQRPPVSWDLETGRSVLWKTPVPGLGHSSPVIWGDLLFVTSAISRDPNSVFEKELKGEQDFRTDRAIHQWRVYALDRTTGRVVWDRLAYEGTPAIPRHPHNSYASATPVTDGRYVVVMFGSEGVYCYDLTGNLVWKKALGVIHAGKHNNPEYTWGTASSPVLHRGLVFVLCDSLEGGYVSALDVTSGREVWRTPRDANPSWSTPAIVESGGHAELVINAAPYIQSYDPATGKELWRLGPSTTNTTPTPIAGEGLIFVANGYNPIKPIYAVVPGSRGDLTLKDGATQSDAIAWSNLRDGPYMTTPLLYRGILYVVSTRGVMTTFEPRTGRQIYQARIAAGGYSASPIAADGRIYVASEEGDIFTIRAGREFEILATSAMHETVMATPALAGNAVYVRTEHAVYAIGGRADSGEPRHFPQAVNLEDTSETSANVSMGDLDGDGDLDLVLAKGRHWPLVDRVLLNNGSGVFVTTDLAPTADRSYSAVLADVDGNGTLDLVLSNDKPDEKLVYLNDGKARFRRAGTWGAPAWATRNAAVADLNGDGRPDIIAANRGGTSNVCLNDGTGRFDATPCLVLPSESATSIVPGDFNKDGAVDLAVPHRDGGQSLIFLNDGNAGFAKTMAFGPAVTNARAAAAGDVNGDGWLDLVVGDERTGTRVYLNDGRGALVPGVTLGDPQTAVGAIAIADLNRDGHADIVIGHSGAPGAVWFNAGDGRRFTDVRFGDGRGAVYGLALGDLNGDGFPDIAAAMSGAPNVVFFSVK